ncbi:MAG: MarR family transcriptional regulator [Crocinitomicaceae bacterium]|jgi:MarR family transcriptional regulator, 2-MHQ and catechol-resistance regulon repressor|nr:MarR family transcriptional regulator [Crocinitomicaceae bacterium]MCF8433764.1 MarR family transcriptional regulator [Crocinitomicaceae bacterium]MDP4637675.1 MarR family transcriptional regulator [Crocinitomicaceae bacterium]MDP4684237.1 MarR family transcriptional regulator [Crocinitomicaceae bacterium]MDP5011389.1 MarR family transcriptional regulator [Crocinitomicaceae bacterium]
MKIEDAIQAKFQSPQHKAVVNLRFTANFLSNIQNNFMAQFHLTMPQFNILRILRGAKDAINVNTVKERMLEKSPNTTRLMDKLIEKELIDRVRCNEDRRVVYVKISEKGLALLAEIDEQFKENSIIQLNISDEDAQHLSELLDKVRLSYGV